MHPNDWRLINSEHIEVIPAALARARGNSAARALARADWLLRRKADGRFLAVRRGDVIVGLARSALSTGVLDELPMLAEADAAGDRPRELAVLLPRLHALGLDAGSYGETSGLSLVAEPHVLRFAGRDRYARPLWLARAAARGWRLMQAAARTDAVILEAISGYRSHDYQLGIFRRKLARGQTVAHILQVNAAPGFSEHHSGCALDIGTPGDPPAEECFETTPAFAWLMGRAGDFGFSLSYPRNNPHGIVYEPWHWCWHPSSNAATGQTGQAP